MRTSIVRYAAALSFAAICSTAAPAARAQAPDPAKLAEAKKHMQAGAAFYNDPAGHKCEEAIREFGKAYELSGSLNALKGMAICNLELERDGDAIEQYTKYLAGKGSSIDAAEKAQIEADLNALKASVAQVTVSADKPGARVTDVRTPSRGFPISNTYPLPIGAKKYGIHPGQHVFTASVEGKPDIVWKVEIANGGKYEHTFEFDKIPAAEPGKKDTPDEKPTVKTRPVPTSVYVMGGLTVALAVPTVILGVRALGLNSEYKKLNGTTSQTTLEDKRSEVQTANLLTDIFLGATVASFVTTGILFFTRPTKVVKAGGGFMVTPVVGASSGGALMVGSF